MKFLTTKQISGEIERVIRDANEFIILISPYVKMSQMYIDRLIEAEKRNVKIFFVFGKEQMVELEESKYSVFSKLKMYYLDNLHAKCYCNEESAIITSMNLYEFSEQNNREMGIVVEKNENEKIYSDISKEASSIIINAEAYLNRKNETKKNQVVYKMVNQGYCIRCGISIEKNPYKPMCLNCYSIWADYENYDYVEKYCHFCGEESETTMGKPLCLSCFKESNKSF